MTNFSYMSSIISFAYVHLTPSRVNSIANRYQSLSKNTREVVAKRVRNINGKRRANLGIGSDFRPSDTASAISTALPLKDVQRHLTEGLNSNNLIKEKPLNFKRKQAYNVETINPTTENNEVLDNAKALANSRFTTGAIGLGLGLTSIGGYALWNKNKNNTNTN